MRGEGAILGEAGGKGNYWVKGLELEPGVGGLIFCFPEFCFMQCQFQKLFSRLTLMDKVPLVLLRQLKSIAS